MVHVLGTEIELARTPGIRRIAAPLRAGRRGNEVVPDLFVGNADMPRFRADKFDRIISVAEDLTFPETTNSFNLVTDRGVRDRDFGEAVEAVRDAMNSDDVTAVHCYEGKERAPTVVAAALALEWDITFNQALGHVEYFHPHTDPTAALEGFAMEYIREHTSDD